MIVIVAGGVPRYLAVMSEKPTDVLRSWVEAFNRADVEALANLYHEDAVNHQVMDDPVNGRGAICEMFEREFAAAEMTCMVENPTLDNLRPPWLMVLSFSLECRALARRPYSKPFHRHDT